MRSECSLRRSSCSSRSSSYLRRAFWYTAKLTGSNLTTSASSAAVSMDRRLAADPASFRLAARLRSFVLREETNKKIKTAASDQSVGRGKERKEEENYHNWSKQSLQLTRRRLLPRPCRRSERLDGRPGRLGRRREVRSCSKQNKKAAAREARRRDKTHIQESGFSPIVASSSIEHDPCLLFATVVVAFCEARLVHFQVLVSSTCVCVRWPPAAGLVR